MFGVMFFSHKASQPPQSNPVRPLVSKLPSGPGLPPTIMLNCNALSEFLTDNIERDETKLVLKYFIMSPAGSLLAYSVPADMNELREQAAAISSAFKARDPEPSEHSVSDDNHGGLSNSGSTLARPLEILTVELPTANVIARQLRPRFILVLVGALAPGQKQDSKITVEYPGDSRYPSTELPAQDEPPEDLSEFERDCKLGVLHVQRKRLDVMAQYILDAGYDKFVMPPEFD